MTIKSTGITFGDKHSSEFGWRVTYYNTPRPEVKEIRDSVPHMDGDYDFTSVYGGKHYNNRSIPVKAFILLEQGVKAFTIKKEIEQWLIDSGWQKFMLDYEDDREYYAQCKTLTMEPDLEKQQLEIECEFEAKPYATLFLDKSRCL